MDKTCIYTFIEDDYNTWECSNCREWWIINDGTPYENRMEYCPCCGSKIIENKIENIDELLESIK
jgi:NAD-dependent SIR2 family protein deacetylase